VSRKEVVTSAFQANGIVFPSVKVDEKSGWFPSGIFQRSCWIVCAQVEEEKRQTDHKK